MKNLIYFALIFLCYCATLGRSNPFPRFSRAYIPRSVTLKQAFNVRGGEVLEAKTSADLEAILIKSAGSLVVVDYWASWCGPCKMIAPLFAELSEEIEGVTFVKVDVDENPDTAAKYQVSAMPTFIFIKGGEVVDRLMGADPNRLKGLIEEYM
eukprot:CAMPEP_0178918192 /NCGR_PEP_ID=MMETSP0786-20121207/13688_1 /TAXON_ID=186022 /ORGANISM="Thalassionema frauenfeldii, Strain CCMP 1798" /LENGTH=152 /DNA_ID=CAMNT_0020591871 /DNA_START=27 /DNA_END=485 /DNA_ORIENTATION=+